MSAVDPTCYRHPELRAGVRCQRCERPICPQCMTPASVGFHCPECVRASGQKVLRPSDLQVRPVATQVLVGINVAVFVLGLVLTAQGTDLTREGGLIGFEVAGGEWWRVVTSGFLHVSLLHIGFNMLLLWLLGRLVEPAVGSARFVVLYFAALLAGSFGVMVLDPGALTVGASGAVFGLMGAAVVAQRYSGVDPWSTGLGPTIAINLVLTFLIPGISIGGHLGGLVGGAVAGYLLFGPPTSRWGTVLPTLVCGAFGLACGAGALALAAGA